MSPRKADKVSLSPIVNIPRPASIANLDDRAILHQFTKSLLNGCGTDIRTSIHDIFLCHLAQLVFDELTNAFRLGDSLCGQMLYAFRERLVSALDNTQRVRDKRHIIIRTVMPTCRTCFQCIVIGILRLFDQHFDTDVLADDIARTIH